MPWFTKGYYRYTIPERYSPAEIARRRVERLAGVAEREAARLEPLQASRRRHSLFPDEARLIEQRLSLLKAKAKAAQKEVEPLVRYRKSNRLFLAAIAGTLQRQRLARQQLSRASFSRAKASAAASGSKYDPYSYFMSDQYQRERFNAFTNRVTSALARSSGLSQLRYAGVLTPCIDRATRREVLFARGHGGKGHRVPHKFNKNSFVPC